MQFIDSCIEIKIKRYREITPSTLFSKSYTVTSIKEYQVKVFFHSQSLIEFRRYRQFSEFRQQLKNSSLPSHLSDKLQPFPKKKLLHKGPKLSEERRTLLEKWIQSILSIKEYHKILLEFLSVPENTINTFLNSSGCKLNPAEKIVASLFRNFNKEKNWSRSLKKFDDEFFDCCEFCLSPVVVSSLLNMIVSLCGNCSVACIAIDILYRMVRIEFYRYAENIKLVLFGNLELLKELKIEKHILNLYPQQTGLQGYFIAKLVKEYFERNSMSQYFKYFLNYNDEAYEMFCAKVENKVNTSSFARSTIVINRTSEWNWLNTDNFPGGLKVCFRKMDSQLEVKAEIFIEASVKTLSLYLSQPDKRQQWDKFVHSISLLKKIDEYTTWVIYTIKPGKKTPLIELALETHKSESLGKYLLTFRSIGKESIKNTTKNQRVYCGECFYEVQNVDVKVRRSSSSTEDIESEEKSGGSLKSGKSVFFVEEKSMSKVMMFLKMNPEMARVFVNDLSEETSLLKESLVMLKKQVEELNCDY